jgi:rsbT co-antagonist protein RsbR
MNSNTQREIESRNISPPFTASSTPTFTQLFEHAGDAHFLLDEGTFIAYNPAFTEMLGYYSEEEHISLTPTNISPPHQPDGRPSLEKAQEKITIALQHGHVCFEWTHQRKDGQQFPVEVSLNTITHDGKTLIYGNWKDITERKQQEQELYIFKTLFDNAPEGIFASGLDGYITYANKALHTLYGYDDDMLGLHISAMAQGDHQRVQALFENVQRDGSWQGNVVHERKDGSTFPVHVSTFLVYNKRGMPHAIASIHHDMTEQVQQEQKRALLQYQTIEAQQAILRELSAPLLPLAPKIVALPLIGSVDQSRAQQILETLLEGIARHQAEIALVDMTGVKTIDTQVAQSLIQTAQAVKLLGARVILTGISPAMAQTLVHLGADLSGMITLSTLQAGIAHALNQPTSG